ncbi:expressed unknown protein [Seminavis robusta]|uniref:Uncharacterized protein n=1 Tax=Seminavis robusta TaxID=568900 RepID=A0A9N8HVV9_9STRA|nr:expressed unknown protein [Seminavis robusta]|eukprot:Sro2437_g327650.1 n/a (537) ;mRNA; r:7328-8938
MTHPNETLGSVTEPENGSLIKHSTADTHAKYLVGVTGLFAKATKQTRDDEEGRKAKPRPSTVAIGMGLFTSAIASMAGLQGGNTIGNEDEDEDELEDESQEEIAPDAPTLPSPQRIISVEDKEEQEEKKRDSNQDTMASSQRGIQRSRSAKGARRRSRSRTGLSRTSSDRKPRMQNGNGRHRISKSSSRKGTNLRCAKPTTNDDMKESLNFKGSRSSVDLKESRRVSRSSSRSSLEDRRRTPRHSKPTLGLKVSRSTPTLGRTGSSSKRLSSEGVKKRTERLSKSSLKPDNTFEGDSKDMKNWCASEKKTRSSSRGSAALALVDGDAGNGGLERVIGRRRANKSSCRGRKEDSSLLDRNTKSSHSACRSPIRNRISSHGSGGRRSGRSSAASSNAARLAGRHQIQLMVQVQQRALLDLEMECDESKNSDDEKPALAKNTVDPNKVDYTSLDRASIHELLKQCSDHGPDHDPYDTGAKMTRSSSSSGLIASKPRHRRRISTRMPLSIRPSSCSGRLTDLAGDDLDDDSTDASDEFAS